MSEFSEWRQDVIERLTRVETNLTNHLESQTAKFNKTTVIISLVIGFLGVVVLFK